MSDHIPRDPSGQAPPGPQQAVSVWLGKPDTAD